jgi:hypothetical protein
MSLVVTVDRYLQEREERKSHNGLSVTDVSNDCPRAVWHRLHRGDRKEFSVVARKKMQYGIVWEDFVRQAMIEAGREVLRPKVMILAPGEERGLLVDAGEFDLEPTRFAGPHALVGHPDIIEVLDDGTLFPWEIKTTMLFRNGGPPSHPDADELRLKSAQYVMQGVGYAYGLGAPRFGVYVSDRGTGTDREYIFDTASEWPLFEERWQMMTAALDPAREPEPNTPPWTRNARTGKSYLCTSCPVTACAFHPSAK